MGLLDTLSMSVRAVGSGPRSIGTVSQVRKSASDGSGGARRAWWKDLPEVACQAELDWLRVNVFHGRAIQLPTRQITARERYSSTLAI